jgi:hypothetical protein
MKNKVKLSRKPAKIRGATRVHCLREITVTYDGQNDYTLIKVPDLSPRGMFVNSARTFPEGAVLNLRFRLALTNGEVRTRCEVRYCLPGVGVGVEFVGISQEASQAIARELALHGKRSSRPKAKLSRARVISRKITESKRMRDRKR